MSEQHSTEPALVVGAGYWRVSEANDRSTAQQFAEMWPRCVLERVRLVGGEGDRGFFDEAVSGGGMAQRDGFLELLAFAQRCHKERVLWDGRPLEAVVCYEASRFSRATSIKTARYIDEFMEAGVFRLFTYERWYDFRKEEDRAIFNLQQDFTNNKYLRELSRRLLRGKKAGALAGQFTGGRVPYGFDRVLVDEKLNITDRIPRGQRARVIIPKDAGGRKLRRVFLSPIPEDDPDPARQLERQTALWIWEQFACRPWSYRGLAESLNVREVPGPDSVFHPGEACPWLPDTVKRILLNPVYAGVARTGAGGQGEHHRLVNGEITAVDPGARRTRDNPGAIEADLPWPGFVSKEVGERVRARVREKERTRTQPREGGYLLNGILKCGHCGGPMYGGTARLKQKSAGGTRVRHYEYRKYFCQAPKKHPGTCRRYSILESRIHKALINKLLRVHLTDERLAAVRARLLERAETKHDKAPAQTERLRQRLTDLEADIRQARRNLLRAADDRVLAEATEELQGWLDERDKLHKALAAAERAGRRTADEATRQVDEAIARVETLRDRLQELQGIAGDPDAPGRKDLGEVLRQLVSRVDLYFEGQPRGTRCWFTLTRGTIKLRPLLSIEGSAARR
jgi:hypothetical protein